VAAKLAAASASKNESVAGMAAAYQLMASCKLSAGLCQKWLAWQ
jgi:hypothetical protein